jgi:outer membrane protein assembly factor BamE (lipoprotein component of BamABCDE complex)
MNSLIWLAITSVFFLVGCHTPTLRKFDRIHTGLEKVDVIDLVGSPKRVDRRAGQDRWTYRFYEKGQTIEREVRFFGPKVVYSGVVIPPYVSASEQDQINERQNLAIESQMNAEKAQRAKLPKFTDFEEYIKGRNRVRWVAPEIPVEPGTKITK